MSLIKLTTTGATDPVLIDDLGAFSIPHPTVDYVIYDSTTNSPFTLEEIRDSIDLQAAIDAGDITIEDGVGTPITDISSAMVISVLDGDTIKIDFSPTNYTRTPVGGLTTEDEELTSHLKGLDDALLAAGHHVQNTDTKLDNGGANEVTAANIKSHINAVTGNPHDVKATQITDFNLEVEGNLDVTANTNARHDAVTLDAGDATQQSATLIGQAITLKQATQTTDGVMSAEDKLKLDNAAGAYTHPDHTGDVSSSGDGVTTIENSVVDNNNLVNMPAHTYKGNDGAVSGTPKDLTKTELLADLNIEDGAEVNVNSDWNAVSGDAEILNKPASFPPNSHNHIASDVTDFDIEVGNNSDVAANTAKVSNATHTGEVTGSGVLTVDSTAISNKALITGASGQEVLVNDAGVLKKVDTADFLDGSGDMLSTNNLSDVTSAATARTNLGVDAAGTDNSTNVTLDTDLDVTEQAANLVGQELELLKATVSTDGVMSSEDKTKLDGIEALADVTDSTNVDAAGATMNADTSTASMSFVIDEDNMVSNSDTKIPTQQSVKAYVDNEITVEKSYQGGYDANTNTPDLDTTPIAGINKGDVYDTTVAGTFFTTEVEVGDSLRARQDNPTLESHWVVVQGNLTAASIKTQYESNADTNAFTDTDVTNLGNQSGTNTGDEVDATTTVKGIVELATDGETLADKVVQGNDSRLNDARTPTAHNHVATDITDFDIEVSNNTSVAANTAKVTNANHTGDVTGSGALTIALNAVTNAKLDDVPTATIKGRTTAGTGNPQDLTATQVRTLLNVEDNANNYTHPNHIGEVTSVADGTQTVAPTAISNKTLVTAATGMEILVNDAGTLKKVDADDLLTGGGAGTSVIVNSIVSIDCTATGDHLIYTVPTGKQFIANRVIARLTAISGAGSVPKISTGSNSTAYDNILGSESLAALTNTLDGFSFSIEGTFRIVQAGTGIYVKVNNASTYTSYTVSFDLIGFLE